MFLLNQHAVVVTTVGTMAHAMSPLSLGCTLERERAQDPSAPAPHLLRITNHDPEDFFAYFTLWVHKDLSVWCSSLSVDAVPFLLEPWREMPTPSALSGCCTCVSSSRSSLCSSGRWKVQWRP